MPAIYQIHEQMVAPQLKQVGRLSVGPHAESETTMFTHFFVAAVAMAIAPPETGAPALKQTANNEFIFNKYPPRALAKGEQGSVRFQAEVDAKGSVRSCRVSGSSGYEQLDRETCDLIVHYANFKPALDNAGTRQMAVHTGVVHWRIPGKSASPKVADAKAKAADEIVCRRISRTGSLVANSRLCKTRREWGQDSDRHQREWGELQGNLGNSRGYTPPRGE